MKEVTNLDANASYGPLPQVLEAVRETAKLLNPSSIHRGGQIARALIEEAREAIRALIGAGSHQRIVFTSGATEANNTAVLMPFWEIFEQRSPRASLSAVTSALEHPSVLEPFRRLERLGVACKYLRYDQINEAGVRATCDESTRLLALMFANNETGEVFDVAAIARQARSIVPNAHIHCDAVQALGKVPLCAAALDLDSLSISGHKIGALAGVGALIVDDRVTFHSLLLGGPQETRHRAGTEPVLPIISFGVAARITKQNLDERRALMRIRRDSLCSAIQSEVTGAELTVDLTHTLPNTLSIRVPGLHADDFVVAMDLEGVGISSGAACASGKPEPSHVLLAMGRSPTQARETIRLSVCAEYQDNEFEGAVRAVVRGLKARSR